MTTAQALARLRTEQALTVAALRQLAALLPTAGIVFILALGGTH